MWTVLVRDGSFWLWLVVGQTVMYRYLEVRVLRTGSRWADRSRPIIAASRGGGNKSNCGKNHVLDRPIHTRRFLFRVCMAELWTACRWYSCFVCVCVCVCVCACVRACPSTCMFDWQTHCDEPFVKFWGFLESLERTKLGSSTCSNSVRGLKLTGARARLICWTYPKWICS